MLFVTSITSIIFLISSINILVDVNSFNITFPNISINKIGYSFLLTFWAIVGWEVIGNYSNDVKNTKTLTNAVIFSTIMVSLIYLLVGSSIVFGDFTSLQKDDFKLVFLLEPIFKSYASSIINIIAVVLCIGTLILFVGGVARLISSLNITSYSSIKSSTNIPIGALNILSFIYILVLVLVYFKILNISDLVTFADGFFISNAIIGLVTAIKLFKNGYLKYSAYLLLAIFILILLSTNIIILSIIVLLFLFTYFRYNEKNYKKEE
jgi:APA family basic amino acid/polyamine antiporter